MLQEVLEDRRRDEGVQRRKTQWVLVSAEPVGTGLTVPPLLSHHSLLTPEERVRILTG